MHSSQNNSILEIPIHWVALLPYIILKLTFRSEVHKNGCHAHLGPLATMTNPLLLSLGSKTGKCSLGYTMNLRTSEGYIKGMEMASPLISMEGGATKKSHDKFRKRGFQIWHGNPLSVS